MTLTTTACNGRAGVKYETRLGNVGLSTNYHRLSAGGRSVNRRRQSFGSAGRIDVPELEGFNSRRKAYLPEQGLGHTAKTLTQRANLLIHHVVDIYCLFIAINHSPPQSLTRLMTGLRSSRTLALACR